MKLVGVALLGLLFQMNAEVIASSVEENNVSMFLQNFGAPFVSREFADQLGRLVIREKYPRDIFLVKGIPTVLDKGESWSLTYSNAVHAVGRRVLPRVLTITIRKSDAAILSIE